MKPPTGPYAVDRAAFERLLTADTGPICDGCQDRAETAVVLWYGKAYCAPHANSELVLDLGRHGVLALPALAFSGADR